ncbi:hypothetical protein Clacol_002953 [Clathrus columnatus]|uniref:Uncharacterized protein n=1 Tax=Clathrus columnatus TaxID=1419009 RepID=A0AAV5A666_9AGAM|nr:hypothetical protein Clacol_002953 [Clathrus columnatus]
MAIISEHSASTSWPFPSITNNYDDPSRAVKRKRVLEKVDYNGGQGSSRISRKRVRTVNVSDASNLPHTLHIVDHDQHDRVDSQVLSADSIDVANFLALLLDGLNKKAKLELTSSEAVKPLSPYQRRPTSPLAQSPHRQPFVRKQVGGHCHGRVEPSLQRWVLYKNHIDESYSPCYRTAEWIETLHEMGWENLHPSYALDGGDIFIPTPEDDSESLSDWIEVDVGRFKATGKN